MPTSGFLRWGLLVAWMAPYCVAQNDTAAGVTLTLAPEALQEFHAKIAIELEAAQVRGAAYAFRGPVSSKVRRSKRGRLDTSCLL